MDGVDGNGMAIVGSVGLKARGPHSLIVWSEDTANSSQTRKAIRSLFGDPLSVNDSMVDDIIREISGSVNSGSEQSAAVVTLLQVLYWSLIVFGIVINLFVWFVFARKSKLRTTRNIFIVNLCTSDILLCSITMPSTLAFLIEAKWTLGPYLCKLMSLMQCSNILVSTGTVIIIALDRYNTIVKSPCACHKHLPTLVYIASLWIISLAISSPMWTFHKIEPVLFPASPHQPVFSLYEVCREHWPNEESRLAFTLALLLIQYLAPIVTLAITHSRIKAFLHEHMANAATGNRIKAEIHRNRRVTLVLTLIVVVYAVSWLPYHLFLILDELQFIEAKARTYSLGFAVCHLLAMTSAVTNPILYGFLNTNFQREWRQLLPSALQWCRRSAPQPARPADAATNTVPMLAVQRHDQLSSTAIITLTSDRSTRHPTDTQL